MHETQTVIIGAGPHGLAAAAHLGRAGVETTVKPLEAGKRFEIKLALSPAAMAKGAIDSTLKIETSSPKKPVLDVPVKGSVS